MPHIVAALKEVVVPALLKEKEEAEAADGKPPAIENGTTGREQEARPATPHASGCAS